MFEDRKVPLRVSEMTAHNQAALRGYRWPDNFASLRQAADWLAAIARADSLRKAALALGVPAATFHNWYSHILGLSLPLMSTSRSSGPY
jgi:DNA-binding NtrC family response regulator